MESVWPHILDVGITASGAIICALVGFVWRISHKVGEIEKRVDALKESTAKDIASVERDINTIYDNVDKNRDWTTSRMMSIVKYLK